MVFRRLFGGGGGQNKKNKKRLSPSTRTADGLASSHPLYQYAMKEYAQTVPHVQGVTQDDGKLRPAFSMNQDEQAAAVMEDTIEQQQQQQQQQHNDEPNNAAEYSNPPPTPPPPLHSPPPSGSVPPSPSILRVPSYKSDVSGLGSVQKAYQRIVFSPRTEYVLSEDMEEEDEEDQRSYIPPQWDPSQQQQQQQQQQQRSKQQQQYSSSIYLEPPMPDTTYEEWYGDAYVGGSMKYIYPSGYQSMRPRSGPWKLSIVVCLLFTWLSIFVIGHCSDRAADQYDGFYNYNKNRNNNNNNANNANDDANNNAAAAGDDANQQEEQNQYFDTNNDIDTKWCGSVLLYWMWVISMLITGLASAYCGVIGYIKVRDFAVANSRSQPPGVVVGKSDYYVQIGSSGKHHHHQQQQNPPHRLGQPVHPSQYQPTIYQADGTPQFWGNQIYRPTQAAVAITSR